MTHRAIHRIAIRCLSCSREASVNSFSRDTRWAVPSLSSPPMMLRSTNECSMKCHAQWNGPSNAPSNVLWALIARSECSIERSIECSNRMSCSMEGSIERSIEFRLECSINFFIGMLNQVHQQYVWLCSLHDELRCAICGRR